MVILIMAWMSGSAIILVLSFLQCDNLKEEPSAVSWILIWPLLIAGVLIIMLSETIEKATLRILK